MIGSTMRIHHSELYHMRGSGIGGVFSSIFRTLVPIAKTIFGIGKRAASSAVGKQVLKAAKRSAVKAGLDLAQDTLAGENVGKSIKKRAKQAGNQLLDDLEAGRGAKGGRAKAVKGKRPARKGASRGKKKKSKPKQATKKRKKKPATGANMGLMLRKLGL